MNATVLPESRTQAYIDDAIRSVLLKNGLPVGPANDLLSKIKAERPGVVGLSLGKIMELRKGERCADKELAYADHYLQARTMVAFLGPPSVLPTGVVVVGYETKKYMYEGLGILDHMASDKQSPSPVPPDLSSVHWGLRGAQDGQGDYIAALSAVGGESLTKIGGLAIPHIRHTGWAFRKGRRPSAMPDLR